MTYQCPQGDHRHLLLSVLSFWWPEPRCCLPYRFPVDHRLLSFLSNRPLGLLWVKCHLWAKLAEGRRHRRFDRLLIGLLGMAIDWLFRKLLIVVIGVLVNIQPIDFVPMVNQHIQLIIEQVYLHKQFVLKLAYQHRRFSLLEDDQHRQFFLEVVNLCRQSFPKQVHLYTRSFLVREHLYKQFSPMLGRPDIQFSQWEAHLDTQFFRLVVHLCIRFSR